MRRVRRWRRKDGARVQRCCTTSSVDAGMRAKGGVTERGLLLSSKPAVGVRRDLAHAPICLALP